MEELKSHNWSLTLVFCLVFAILGFITGKVTGNKKGDGNRFMLHKMKSGLHGHNKMNCMSEDGRKTEVMVEIGEGGKVIVDIDTTYEEDGKKVRKVEKRILKED